MEDLTDLEHIRKRPGMYVCDTAIRGLHHIVDELLDNSIDQFLAHRLTSVSVSASGAMLDFTDDGPGLPFDEPGFVSQSLAWDYLTQLRRHFANCRRSHTSRTFERLGLRTSNCDRLNRDLRSYERA